VLQVSWILEAADLGLGRNYTIKKYNWDFTDNEEEEDNGGDDAHDDVNSFPRVLF
jgi:hypothetical protein